VSTRRGILACATAFAAAAAVPLPIAAVPGAPVDPDNPFGLIQGVDYITWWDRCELEALLRQFKPLAEGA